MKWNRLVNQIIEKKTGLSIDFWETYGRGELNAMREKVREIVRKEIADARENEREIIIMKCHDRMDLTAKQIANVHDFTIKYVQSVIDKYEKIEKSDSSF